VIETYLKIDGKAEVELMSALNMILDKIAEKGVKAEAEKSQVLEALSALKTEIADLKAKLESTESVPVDVVLEALDGLGTKIDAIYEPEPPVEPETPAE
jgi:predicted  nucleic acid-binding Zn-ribbon protein